MTKFELEFDNVQTSNVFNRFKIWRMFKRFVIEFEFVKIPCSTTDFIFTESQRVQTNQFFSLKFNILHNLQLLNVKQFLLSDVLQLC